MTGLLRAEVRKLTRRKLFWVMLVILMVVMGMAAVFLLVVPARAPEAVPGMPVIRKPDAYLLGAQQAIGQSWFPIVLAAVAMGGEMRSAAFAATLTRDSRRWAHLFARLAVFAAASWSATLLAIGEWAAVTAVLASGEGAPDVDVWVGMVWKSGLVVSTWTALALAAVTLFRSLGPALGAALAFSFVDGLVSLWTAYRPVSLSTNSTAMLGELSGFASGMGFPGLDPIPPGRATMVVAAWAVGLVGVAWASLQLRDV